MNFTPTAIASLIAPIYWMVISSVFLTVGDIMFRWWLEQQWPHGFALSCGIYALGMFCLIMSFFGENIAIATVIGITLNVIFYLAYAYFAYGDTLSTKEIIGIFTGLAAIYLLEF